MRFFVLPIHYDTIEDGRNKKSPLLFSFLVRIELFFSFYRRNIFDKNIITSFHWFHLNNYTPYENKCFNPRNQIHRVAFVTRVNSICVQMRHAMFTRVKYATTPRKSWTRYPPRYSKRVTIVYLYHVNRCGHYKKNVDCKVGLCTSLQTVAEFL